ncbi:imidazoleglycerol-phosphate dehydratase HisB [Deferribacter autotrophicus]|uniref:Imidazoleglycerol-phosphate dehydratase n=1 Tax=Deferribacter autotrophicus TaxID=500465 RepID=A0A5A8F8R1_9BACT|nr:imidazoleglycerol-phosphate dehydratase HisB [Deferribacter autotrophicus]KAA0258892.1 imidazoleglycerol-phosphate dehydratase HisB [Deferribacter autotrophicus]
MRRKTITRSTGETTVEIDINLDGNGEYEISTPVGFFNHMLELFAHHAKIDLKIKADGDIDVDYHHLVEDIGITLGKCFYEALGDKRGIERYGFFLLPMDETLVEVSLDFSGRGYLNFDVEFFTEKIGEFPSELVEEFFKAFAENAKCTLHIVKRYGKNSHHISEAIFKGVARAIKFAIAKTGDTINSTKGVLE